jgi:intracellular multiplication protein IcmL
MSEENMSKNDESAHGQEIQHGFASYALVQEVLRLQETNKDLKKKNLRTWSIALFSVALSGVFMLLMTSIYPKVRYIPTRDNRAICEVPSIAEPFVSSAAVADFSKEALIEVYSYGYIDWRESLNRNTNKYFTPSGRRGFMKSLEESGNLEKIIKGRLYSKAGAIDVAQIEAEGSLPEGRYFWDVKVPFSLSIFLGGDDKPQASNQFLATIRVVREQATASNLRGIAVESIITKPYQNKGFR